MRSKLYISCSFILFHFVIFDPFPPFFPGPERGPEGGPERGSRKGVQKGGSTFCLHPPRPTENITFLLLLSVEKGNVASTFSQLVAKELQFMWTF